MVREGKYDTTVFLDGNGVRMFCVKKWRIDLSSIIIISRL